MARHPERIDSLERKVSIPDHVVYRSFASETIVLNLETGTYHGLNGSAARMLDTLKASDTMSDAVAVIAELYGQPVEVVATDLRQFCQDLVHRGLLQLDGPAQSDDEGP